MLYIRVDKTGPKIVSIRAKRLDFGGFKGETNIPGNKDLKPFYLDFRFFYNKGDPTYFLKIRNLISKATIGEHEQLYLKSQTQGDLND